MQTELNEFWDILVEYEIATEEELKLICGINGFNKGSLNDVLYYKTGYRDLNQYKEVL